MSGLFRVQMEASGASKTETACLVDRLCFLLSDDEKAPWFPQPRSDWNTERPPLGEAASISLLRSPVFVLKTQQLPLPFYVLGVCPHWANAQAGKGSLDVRLLDVLKAHKQRSDYTQPSDWVFASPDLNGKMPRSYTCFYEKLGRACQDAGIKHVSAHSFRHSYRAWLDELGTPISVQQRAMRHGDIRVTMNVYGDPVGDALRDASSKVAERAIGQLLTKSVS
jgi:hypothetical protein